jgi:zinc transport system substrate-binding protein
MGRGADECWCLAPIGEDGVPCRRSVKVKGSLTAMVLALATLALFSSCAAPGGDVIDTSESVVRVWVSVVPQEYFVERIGGERVVVEVMVPPGASPATYEPKPSQIESLANADLYVRIRVPFEEAWMSRIEAANQGMSIVDQSSGIERIGGTDPHVWLSPRLAKTQADNIYQGLVEVDPSGESFYRANLEAFLTDLDELDARIEETLSGLEVREFMVFHPAWSYFARDYGLTMIPVQIEGSDPSAAEMTELVRTARSHNIKVIFAQPEFSTRSADTIAEEIGGRVLLISPLAPDWLENLERVADTFAEVLGEQQQ